MSLGPLPMRFLLLRVLIKKDEATENSRLLNREFNLFWSSDHYH